MPRNAFILIAVYSLLGLAGLPALAQHATSDAEATYLIVDCMKSTSSDYANLERDVWKPIHQELVDQGKKLRWGFYRVLFGDRSECDYYTTNAVTHSQLNDDVGFRAAFEKVHAGKDFDKMMTETAASREMVWTQLWYVLDLVPPKEFSYVQVNQMLTDHADAYVDMEKEIYKPVHTAMVEQGATAGWGLYSLRSPHGSSIGYNYGTADFLNSLGGINFPYFMRQAHPDKDVEAMGERMDEVRDVIKSEVWMLLAQTIPSE